MPTERRSQNLKVKVKKGKDKDRRGRSAISQRSKFEIEAALGTTTCMGIHHATSPENSHDFFGLPDFY